MAAQLAAAAFTLHARQIREELVMRIRTLGVALILSAAASPSAAQQAAPPRDVLVLPGVIGAGPAAGAARDSALPPLPADAQFVVDQWKQNLTGTVEQLRFMQQSHRDNGNAEAAGAIAAQVRTLQPPYRPAGQITADLVNEGLPNPFEPVRMSRFRGRAGETLSFAIRGRDDQAIWGTTTYTDDSALETAAVHAGLLRAGQVGVVTVKVLPGQQQYQGSERNGVTSHAFEQHGGSFLFAAVSIFKPQRTNQLASYRDLVGQSITIPIVGAPGRVWGTDVYTDDSSPAAAAVHAGLLDVGEFGFVRITLLPGQERYDESARNGVNSDAWGAFEGSFRIERAPEPVVRLPGGEDTSRIVNLASLRSRPGTTIDMQVTGAASGPIWGSDFYTDDSSIAVAAVHAGVLKPGETGVVRVTIGRARDSYAGSERNGVRTSPYGKFEGTFRVERGPK
jgi:hypothetical protein